MTTPKPEKRFNSSTTTAEVLEGIDLTGKTVVITGTTNGIGVATAEAFVRAGAHVVMFVRNTQLADEHKQRLLTEKSTYEIDIVSCDLNSLASVKQAAADYVSKKWPIHILILNAGIVGVHDPPLSADGFEKTFAVNHLAQYYLFHLLLPVMKREPNVRVVVVSSDSHKKGTLRWLPYAEKFLDIGPGFPTNLTADQLTVDSLTIPVGQSTFASITHYGKSKLCNVWMAKALDRRYSAQGIRVNALHPGTMIKTNIAKDWMGKLVMLIASPFSKTIDQGASTSVYVAVAPELEHIGGEYFSSCYFSAVNPLADSIELQDKLIEISDQLIEKALPKQ